MTALKRSVEIERFLNRPDPSVLIALIYGPDPGLVNERVKTLVKSVSGSLDDPFSIVRINDGELSGDPGRLTDEANALTFGGARRIVWIDGAGQNTARAFNALADSAPEALVVAGADNLKPSSQLRKFAETRKFAVSIPCFSDDAASLNSVLDEELKKYNLAITADGRRYFIALLGADRQLSRREIEKLCLYAAKKEEITADDIRQISGDATAPALDNLCDAVGSGNSELADRLFIRTIASGTAPGTIVSQLIRHFTMLDWVASKSEQGRGGASQFIRQYRPMVFFKRLQSVEHQAALWCHKDLIPALNLLQQAESQCRNSKLPVHELAQRAILSLSISARRRQRRC